MRRKLTEVFQSVQVFIYFCIQILPKPIDSAAKWDYANNRLGEYVQGMPPADKMHYRNGGTSP